MEWSRDIYNGITLDHVASENEHGLQKSYTVTYDPQTTQIRPILNYGPYEMCIRDRLKYLSLMVVLMPGLAACWMASSTENRRPRL